MRPALLVTIFVILIVAVFVSLPPNGSATPYQEPQPIAIVGATLIDGSGGAPVTDSVVVLKGDSIVAAGKRNQVQVPAGARVIDAAGLVVAPGFIDAHNHSDRGFADDPSA